MGFAFYSPSISLYKTLQLWVVLRVLLARPTRGRQRTQTSPRGPPLPISTSCLTAAKKPYEVMAAKDKERYTNEMAAYKGKTVDPNKPKRPPTAYFLFLADFRVKMANKGIEHKELLKMAGEEWRNLSSEDKVPYEKNALVESKKYEEAMTEYRKGGGGASPAKKARVEPEDDEEEDDDEEEEDDDDEDDE